MATTPNRNLALPQGSELISQGDDAIRDLANKLDGSASLIVGLFSARPATPPVGTFYFASDVNALYLYVGYWREEAGGAPVGSISDYAGAGDPSDPRYVLCDGRLLSRTTYAKLYTVLGGASSPWGQGDSSTTFNVPNLNGRFTVGTGAGPGVTARSVGASGGQEQVTLTASQIPAHTHPAPGGSFLHTDGPGTPTQVHRSADVNYASPATGANVGGGGSHENLPPFVAVQKIIRVL